MKLISKILTTSLGVGFLPLAPGTWGAAIGCLIVWLLSYYQVLNTPLLAILIIVFTLISVPMINTLEEEWGEDPSKVVIDETVGLWITMLFVPFNFQNLLLAFILFRFFDIAKPLGIRKLEQIKNGWGVMLDDVLAGVYANIVLQFIIYFI